MSNLVDEPFNFKVKLINWYQTNKRDLPWRSTKDPYKIWLSEIILQQTRVDQGLPYYLKFIKHYPTVKELAEASEEEILKDWQGLGYYSRARNLHAAAKYIALELNGTFPSTYDQILQLKGIGSYTAAAIASFAFNLPQAVLDGNVFRVLSRIWGDSTPIDSSKGKKKFLSIAQQLLDKKTPAEYNQAIMEFGALQCIPLKPNCQLCPFQTDCVAYKTESIHLLPFKEKKIKQKNRFFNYLILENSTDIIVNKRSKKDIWQNLFDFPLIETSKEIQLHELAKKSEYIELSKDTLPVHQTTSEQRKHILSHQIIHAKFFHFYLESTKEVALKNSDYQLINKKNLSDLPIPKLIENYLKEETNFLSLFT